ncbi:MAG: FAD:protein FMN transferase, partial [Lachnospiraceae bacterium]|nr:FAD:protein FMN transferase [Lachnospiraceae bacterium]
MQKFNIKFIKKYVLFFILSCFTILAGCSTPFPREPLSQTGFYFDTVITVTVYDHGSEELLDQCMELASYYENLLSPYIEGSDIWNVNHNNGSFVTVDEETLSLLKTALSYAELSDGLVDPSIGTLSQLWNFGSDNQKIVPEKKQIDEALAYVDYGALEIRNGQVMITKPGVQIDLGFIAKGFIGDRMKEFLSSKGVASALINLGGNVVILGSKPDGSPFRIGIQEPFAPSGICALTLDLSDISAVSSGNYERYFEKDGILYHHILSTETGYPAQSSLTQVTILSPSSVDGDALSTLCYILGYEKAVQLLKN